MAVPFLVGALALWPAQSATAAHDGGLLSILVMGDSYSAGNGAGAYYGAKGCRRSARNYARRYASLVEQPPSIQRTFVENVACSGDTTEEVFRSRHKRPPQLNAVNNGYDLIFLTIGGNDLKFGKIVKFCLIAATRDGANCGPLLTQAERALRNGSLEQDITRVLRSIRARADRRARIVLLGYPYLEGDPGYRLRSGHWGNRFIEAGKRLRELTDAGDATQKRVVKRLNAQEQSSPYVFVSTKRLFAGPPNHTLFAQKRNPHRWFVQPLTDAALIDFDLLYHPNPTGWRKTAELLFRHPRVPRFDLNSDPAHAPLGSGGGSSTNPGNGATGPGGGDLETPDPGGGGPATRHSPRLVLGSEHSCGLREDGTAACWGNNAYGQATPPPGRFTDLGGGYMHTCGLREDGIVECWGRPFFGQTTPPGGAFKQLTGGWEHTCGLRQDGSVACWGTNIYGESSPLDGVFTRIATGGRHSCGLREDGTAACWGRNDLGQASPPGGTFTQLTAGFDYTCGLREDATAVCWGESSSGQSAPPVGPFSRLAGGYAHVCGLRAGGEVACWGSDRDGQSSAPSGQFVDVAAGARHACGTRPDGTVECWGDDSHGQSTVPGDRFI